LIERSFQGLSIAIKTMRIVKELMDIWLNEVCDSKNNKEDWEKKEEIEEYRKIKEIVPRKFWK